MIKIPDEFESPAWKPVDVLVLPEDSDLAGKFQRKAEEYRGRREKFLAPYLELLRGTGRDVEEILSDKGMEGWYRYFTKTIEDSEDEQEAIMAAEYLFSFERMIYKEVGARLLAETGKLDLEGFKVGVEEIFGEDEFDRDIALLIMSIFEDYIETGGENISGGTGF